MSQTATPLPADQSAGSTRLFVDKGAWAMRLVFLVLAVAIMVGASGYGLRTQDGLVGPGLVPFAAGLVMALATCWECVKTIRAERLAGAAVPQEETVDAMADLVDEDTLADMKNTGGHKAVLMVFAAVLAAVVLSHLIGLLLALSTMVAGLIIVVEKKKWWTGLVAGVIAFAFGYVVFGLVLNVPLPTGMLGLV